jgi:tripeptidyl-peptidase-1
MLILTPVALCFAASFLSPVAATALNARRYHELARVEKRLDQARNGWIKRSAAPSNGRIKLHIALRQEDPAELEKIAMDIATPGHARYRQHLTAIEVAHLSRPAAGAVDGVQSWLSDVGLSGTLNHDMIVVDASIKEAEALLNTTYHRYEHQETRKLAVRTSEYSVPRSLHDMIDFVSPTTQFGLRMKHQSSPLSKRSASPHAPPKYPVGVSNASCGDASSITLDCIRFLYNIDHVSSHKSPGYAVFGTQEALFNKTDLTAFLQLYNPMAANAHATFEQIGLNGNTINAAIDGDNSEVQLDTQYALGLAYPAPGVLFINGDDGSDNFTGDAASNDHYLAFLQQMAFNKSVPAVVTTSSEDNEGNLSPAYARRVCNGFAKAGARGVTFLFSSGDAGIQGAGSPFAVYDLDASFPGSCPFVTTVGGTVVQSDLSESAMTLATTFTIASSGGFSTLFARPSYQNSQVLPYVATINPDYATLTGYNGTTGRGFPDIAAVGWNNPSVIDGVVGNSGGTSISSPIVAAIITLLNDIEHSRGRPPLGFINPWLYSNPGAFNAITGGFTNQRPSEPGFPIGFIAYDGPLAPLGYNVSDSGWDPITGLGSPNFEKLVAALL